MDGECGSARKDAFDVALLHDVPNTYVQTDHVNKISIMKERRQIRRKTLLERERIFKAVSSHDVDAAKRLLSSGARPNVFDDKMRTPLHIAAASADLRMVKLLLQYKADPNRKDIVGNTCLHLAACNCSIPIVTMLLENGADANSLDGTGKNPMQLAAGRLRCIRQNRLNPNRDTKREIFSIISLMQVYSKKKEMENMVAKLDEISSQLEETSLKDDIEAIGDLLHDLTNLNVEGGH